MAHERINMHINYVGNRCLQKLFYLQLMRLSAIIYLKGDEIMTLGDIEKIGLGGKKLGKTCTYRIILITIIAIQVVYISCLFGFNKKGFHSDELWNYGFANSTEGKHIYASDDGKQIKNFDSWQNSDNLRKYITVDKNEIFNYAAIYKNAANDYNPPLGYMMLHFICSLFPGTWSKWYCFALNIICFVIMQIYIYRLAESVTNSETAGLLSVFFFGFTAGARNITIFLRIYAPATMFAIMLIYYMHELYMQRDTGKARVKLYVKIFIVNILGCFTLNLFLPFAFIATAMYCIYYLFSKKIKKLLEFGLMMLVSVGVSIAMFPVRISQVTGGKETLTYINRKFSTMWQNKIYWAYLTNDLFGVHNSIWKTMTLEYILIGVGIAAFFIIPMCFVFRNETWLKKVITTVKKNVIYGIKNIKNISYTYIVLISTVAFMVFVAAARTSTYSMGDCTTRYIFIIYPVMAVFSVTAVYSIIRLIIRKYNALNIVCILLCIIFSLLSNILSPDAFYFIHTEEGTRLTDIGHDANVIIVTNSQWLITCYTCELYNTNSYYAADYESAMTDDYNLTQIDGPVYLVLDVTRMDGNNDKVNVPGANAVDIKVVDKKKEYKSEDYIEYFKEQDGVSAVEYIGTDAVFGRPVKIYKIK